MLMAKLFQELHRYSKIPFDVKYLVMDPGYSPENRTVIEENRSKRVEVKELIRTMKQTNPFVESNIFRSVENVNLDTMICYKTGGEKHHFLETYDSKD